MAHDTLIIGAGMSGLAAGIRLAQFDRPVAILERHSLWGGLNSFYKLKGRSFDSGLHALTNFAPKNAPGRPLTRILRQLRIPWDALQLDEQRGSRILSRGRSVRFSNDEQVFWSELAREFPRDVDALRQLVAEFPSYDAPFPPGAEESTRAILGRRLRDPELVELLLLPTCLYGSARENDIDWDQFTILFRAMFLEGFARPRGDIRGLLDLLVQRYKAQGGELRTNCGVQKILTRGGAAVGVVLDSGEELACERVFSSAGSAETRRLLDSPPPERPVDEGPRLSFFESISVLDAEPAALGYEDTVTFFDHGEHFRYRVPEGPLDVQSGVVCSANNYARPEPLEEGVVRITALANHARWSALPEGEYAAAKDEAAAAMLASAARAVPALARLPEHTRFRDTFTPRTIEHYTGHVGGAVYGAPRKSRDGSTGVARLSLIGADQGLLGITGALLSGIGAANRHALAEVVP